MNKNVFYNVIFVHVITSVFRGWETPDFSPKKIRLLGYTLELNKHVDFFVCLLD